VTSYQAKERKISDDSILHICRRENLKFNKTLYEIDFCFQYYLREDTKPMQHPCVSPLLRLLSCYLVGVPLVSTKSFAFYALCFGVIPLCITICFSNKEVKVPWTFVKSWLRATGGGREKNFCYLAVEVFNSVCVLHTKHCLALCTARRRDWFCPVTEFVKIPVLFPRSLVSQTQNYVPL
jgi:hypothetical protein